MMEIKGNIEAEGYYALMGEVLEFFVFRIY